MGSLVNLLHSVIFCGNFCLSVYWYQKAGIKGTLVSLYETCSNHVIHTSIWHGASVLLLASSHI